MKLLIDNVFKYKAEMMGIAIILIIAFHTILPQDTPKLITEFKRFGEIGVDIFLFIGGITVASSFQRTNDIIRFYKKRLIRILPAYLLIWGFIHMVFTYRYSLGIVSYIQNVSLWNCIVHNELRNWYIAAILIMYLITPLYIFICRKYKTFILFPVVLIVIGCLMSFNYNVTRIPMFMFWLRLPVYLIGVDFFLLGNREISINSTFLCFMAILSVMGAVLIVRYKVSENPIELRRFLYIPIVLFFVSKWKYSNGVLKFIGAITLELYLLHEFIQGLMCDLLTPPLWVYFPLSVLLAVLIGYSVHDLLGKFLLNEGSVCYRIFGWRRS